MVTVCGKSKSTQCEISVFCSYNVCVMAYGQTGSGKTHTMVGSHDNDLYNINLDPHPEEGIIPRAVRELFRFIKSVYAF